MDQLPPAVTALLQSNHSDRTCCSHCGGSAQDSPQNGWTHSDPGKSRGHSNIANNFKSEEITCTKCRLPLYCSEVCKNRHSKDHGIFCGSLQDSLSKIPRKPPTVHTTRVDLRLSYAGRHLSAMVHVGDEIIRMGFNCDVAPNRRRYYREALTTYLEGMAKEKAFDGGETFGSRAEDRVLLLLIVLGGDAQLLLDWLSFTAGDEDSGSDNDANQRSTSFESEEKLQHPLLALHGLFEKDTVKEGHTTLSNLYLLVSCRSLIDHRRNQKSLAAYQSAVKPQQLAAVDGNIASFLWGKNGYEYGEALSDEIPRILNHIQKHKKDGISFLEKIRHGSMKFTPRKAPCLLTDKEGPEFPSRGRVIYRVDTKTPPVANVPEFWVLYQECYLAMKPDLDLKEFLPSEHSKSPAAKDKRD